MFGERRSLSLIAKTRSFPCQQSGDLSAQQAAQIARIDACRKLKHEASHAVCPSVCRGVYSISQGRNLLAHPFQHVQAGHVGGCLLNRSRDDHDAISAEGHQSSHYKEKGGKYGKDNKLTLYQGCHLSPPHAAALTIQDDLLVDRLSML